MSTFFSLRRSADEDGRTAGGKIMRSRGTRAADRTPYTRPTPPPAEEPVAESSGNPNWLSGLIYPARAMASGAGRILSSVFGPDSLSSSSSSSAGDSDDEDDASNAAEVDMNKEPSSMNSKSHNMHLIQQLVMQQTFSREESDELIKLIRSRVVEGDGNLNNTDVCNNAVMEARKWLEEKKAKSGSKLKVGDFVTNHGALSLVTHGEMGSPVDMAKSYMQAQPTWSSPAFKHAEFSTPIRNAKDIFHSPVQISEMKGSALSTGSWNILDEIRRVRTKATEELLATTPSKNISLPSVFSGDKSMQDTMTKNVNDEKIKLNSDPNKYLGLHATNDCKMPESGEMECEKAQGGALQANNGGETTQVIGDSDAGNGTDPDVNSNQLDGYHLSHEINGLRDSATNDHALSLSAADQTLEPLSKEAKDGVDSSKEKLDVTMSGNSQLNHANENDHLFSTSQDSSSMLYEGSSQDVDQTNPNHKGNDATPGRKLRPRKKGPITPKHK